MPRLFIATPITPTPGMLAVLDMLAADYGHIVRPVPADNLHLTYRFLGEVDDARIPGLADTLSRGLHDEIGGPVDWRGPVTWPTGQRRPRLLTLLPEPFLGPGILRRIADGIDRMLDGLDGIEPRDRPFVPHLTIARFRRNAPSHGATTLTAWLQHQHAQPRGRTIVNAVELIQSDLTSDGARYTVRHHTALT